MDNDNLFSYGGRQGAGEGEDEEQWANAMVELDNDNVDGAEAWSGLENGNAQEPQEPSSGSPAASDIDVNGSGRGPGCGRHLAGPVARGPAE